MHLFTLKTNNGRGDPHLSSTSPDLLHSRDSPVGLLLDGGGTVALLRGRHTSRDRRRLRNDIPLSAILHLLAVHTRCKAAVVGAGADLVAALVEDVFDVEGVDVAGEVTVYVSGQCGLCGKPCICENRTIEVPR